MRWSYFIQKVYETDPLVCPNARKTHLNPGIIGDVATFMAFHDSRSYCQRLASRLPRRAARYTDSGHIPNGSANCLPLRPNHSTH